MSLTHKDYTVGWISALPDELASAQALLDEEHEDLPAISGDHNAYTLGRIGKHNIVIAGLPRGRIGTTPAATIAANLLRSFPNVRFGLLVGVGGGVPEVVRLGDIVVSCPEGRECGVIQYDFGTSTQEAFVRKGTLPEPPTAISTAITKLSALARRKGYRFNSYHEQMLADNPRMTDFKRPNTDVLYKKEYMHEGSKADCSKCDPSQIIDRISHTESNVHYGLIGSGNSVIRDALLRDELYKLDGIICFDMEAAGLMRDFPCLVIRGICDYCDTHKNKEWQPYAGAIAGAYAKELLLTIPGYAVENMPINDLVTAVNQQTTELKALHVTQKEAYETASATQTTIKNIDTRLEAAEKDTLQQKDLAFLRALNISDPRHDKQRIENLKGGLFRNCYKWILQSKEFQEWCEQGRLLWIKGDPGKGKTMLICGLIDELENPVYFFCEATGTNTSASAVLRGLIYSIARHDPIAIVNVRDKIASVNELHGVNAWYILAEVLEEMISLRKLIIIVDALDECRDGKENLIKLIAKLSISSPSKWIISSRNHKDIEDVLNVGSKLSLELNAEYIAQSVSNYIEYKVVELARQNSWTNELSVFVSEYLQEHAESTFLWVALVCDSLKNVQPWDTKLAVKKFPSGLEAVYTRMLRLIEELGDIHELPKRILVVAITVVRPVTLAELTTIMDLPDGMENSEWLSRAVSLCGSFLGLQDNVIQFVHETAADYISEHVAPLYTPNVINSEIYQQSTRAMSTHLRKDIYNLQHPWVSMDDIETPTPDPLADLGYACNYWVQHWCLAGNASDEHLLDFLRKCFLYWLEALCLQANLSLAAKMLDQLQTTISNADLSSIDKNIHQTQSRQQLRAFLNDARSFMICFREGYQYLPLQIYYSGLPLAPANSAIKAAFASDMPPDIVTTRNLVDSWNDDQITITASAQINCLAFNLSATYLAACLSDGTIQVWDCLIGAQLYVCSSDKLRATSGFLDLHMSSLAFNSHGTSLLCHLRQPLRHDSLSDQIISWNFATGVLKTVLEIDTWTLTGGSLAISPNGRYVSFFSKDTELHTYDMDDSVKLMNQRQPLLTPLFDYVGICFSPDETALAVHSSSQHEDRDRVDVRLLDDDSYLGTLHMDGRSKLRPILALSTQGHHAAVLCSHNGVEVYDVSSGQRVWKVDSFSQVRWISYTVDDQYLAVQDLIELCLYDVTTHKSMVKFEIHNPTNSDIGSVLSIDAKRFAAQGFNHTGDVVILAKLGSDIGLTALPSARQITGMKATQDGRYILLRLKGRCLELWDNISNKILWTESGDRLAPEHLTEPWQWPSFVSTKDGFLMAVRLFFPKRLRVWRYLAQIHQVHFLRQADRSSSSCNTLGLVSSDGGDLLLNGSFHRYQIAPDGRSLALKWDDRWYLMHLENRLENYFIDIGKVLELCPQLSPSSSNQPELPSDLRVIDNSKLSPTSSKIDSAEAPWQSNWIGEYITWSEDGSTIACLFFPNEPTDTKHLVCVWESASGTALLQPNLSLITVDRYDCTVCLQHGKLIVGRYSAAHLHVEIWSIATRQRTSVFSLQNDLATLDDLLVSCDESLAVAQVGSDLLLVNTYTAGVCRLKIPILPSENQTVKLLKMTNDSLTTDQGCLAIVNDRLRYGTLDEIFFDGTWLYRNGHPLQWVPPHFQCESEYAAGCLTLASDRGGHVVLRFLGRDSVVAARKRRTSQVLNAHATKGFGIQSNEARSSKSCIED